MTDSSAHNLSPQEVLRQHTQWKLLANGDVQLATSTFGQAELLGEQFNRTAYQGSVTVNKGDFEQFCADHNIEAGLTSSWSHGPDYQHKIDSTPRRRR